MHMKTHTNTTLEQLSETKEALFSVICVVKEQYNTTYRLTINTVAKSHTLKTAQCCLMVI